MLTFVQKLKKSEIGEPNTDTTRTAAAEQAYKKAGLERASHKYFRRKTLFKAWGGEVDGVKGRVSAPLEMRREIWKLSWMLLRRGSADKKFLQRLLGYYAFIFKFRRELLSVFHHVCKYVERRVAENPSTHSGRT
jgi:hypothetical protein